MKWGNSLGPSHTRRIKRKTKRKTKKKDVNTSSCTIKVEKGGKKKKVRGVAPKTFLLVRLNGGKVKKQTKWGENKLVRKIISGPCVKQRPHSPKNVTWKGGTRGKNQKKRGGRENDHSPATRVAYSLQKVQNNLRLGKSARRTVQKRNHREARVSGPARINNKPSKEKKDIKKNRQRTRPVDQHGKNFGNELKRQRPQRRSRGRLMS